MNYITVGIVWIIAFICWRIMKKIQPESSGLYLVYVIFICVLVTSVAVIRLYQV